MTEQEKKAYESGRRMAEHVISRIGETGAMERGSLADIRYVRKSLSEAYDQGYWDVLLGL